MKKIFIAALGILPLAAGCETEATGGMDYTPKQVYKLFADVDCQSSVTVDTKSTFDFDDVVWQAGDAFSMFCTGHENVRMILTRVTGSSEGMFAGRSDETDHHRRWRCRYDRKNCCFGSDFFSGCSFCKCSITFSGSLKI